MCLGLAEVLANTTKHQVEAHLEQLIVTVQDALCDDDQGVREQAGSAFQMLHRMVGAEAVDAVVPSLLRQLRGEKGNGGDGDESDEDESENEDGGEGEEEEAHRREKALFGLCQVLRLRSRELLPVVVGPLLKRPLPLAHIHALGTIAQACPRDIHHVAHKILPVVVAELCALDNTILTTTNDEEGGGGEAAAAAAAAVSKARKHRDALDAAACLVVSSVTTNGIQFFGVELLKSLQTTTASTATTAVGAGGAGDAAGADSCSGGVADSSSSAAASTRKWGVRLLEHLFASNKSADYLELVPMFLKDLVKLFVDKNRGVLDAVRERVWFGLSFS